MYNICITIVDKYRSIIDKICMYSKSNI